MIKLFENIDRTFQGPASHNENTYNYYQRSARKDISTIRETLNNWFNKYPDSEKKELKSSFKKKFDDCFYELFLYQLFTNLNFEIEVHPTLPNSPKKPDFLIKKGTYEVYVEAKIVKNKSHQQEALDRKINEFYDNLSKLNSKGFLLNIDTFILKTPKQPSTEELIKQIELEIEKIDPDIVTEEVTKNGFDSIPIIEIENEDIHIIIKPMPVIPSAREIKKRPIGMYPIDSFWGGGEESLKDSISLKAKRYGKLDKPFLVCVNSLDMKTSGTIDIENAIWGSLAISWSTDPSDKDEKWIRKKDGLFLSENKIKLANLSGVLVTKVFPHNVPSANYWLFKHPFSENELDFNLLGLKYNYVEKGKINSILGDDLSDIFQINHDWLNE